MRGKNSQISTGQHFVNRGTRQRDTTASNVDGEKIEPSEHRIDIADESSDLLGYDIFSGKLALVKQKKIGGISFNEPESTNNNVEDSTDAKLSSKALVWGAQMLSLEDVISVSYSAGLRHFTVHSYIRKRSRLTCIFKPKRSQKDFCFLATSAEEAIQWINGFAEQQCFVKCLPHPFAASNKHSSELLVNIPQFDQLPIKCKSSPRVLVILNPRSGHGRSSKVFYEKAAPIFELAGFTMEVVKTTAAGHAKKVASTVDFSTCPNGIICVGGDGIVNEVLNGLLSRDNQKEAISIPIGIIPAGSDNSLVWTILGVRDPISAAITIVKGGLTATDVFAVEWIQNGIIHYGTTVSYFGFLSDVLELSEKYQRRFGPLRYFVAGFLKFLCIPKYDFEIEYLPLSEFDNRQLLENTDKIEMSDLYTDIMGRSTSMPKASSLSIIESVGVPTKAQEELYTVSSEPYDPKSKRQSKGKRNRVEEPEEVIHPQLPISTTPNRARTRTLKSRTNDQRSSWTPAMDNREDSRSTTPDHSPIWDAEPKCEDSQETEVHIELPCQQEEVEEGTAQEFVPNLDQKWIVKKGAFIGVLACNHSCKTVQSLSSQVVAPHAVHDDTVLDLLMVQGSGRLRLLRFLILLQFGRHLSLPYVEYVKVKSVKLRAVRSSQNGCGIDGELLKHNGQIMCSMLPDQCRLLGRPARDSV